MENILELAELNQKKARKVLQDSDLFKIWESVGAEVHLVGSLKMGLLMKHRDIDLHIYSAPLRLTDSFAAMAKFAEDTAVQQIEFRNLLHTEEKCVEWHAWYKDEEGEIWQIDMIHIIKGSFYDGYFEQVAERIEAVLTPEYRYRILSIKNTIPDTEKVMGIEVYQAVIRDGIKDYEEFTRWRKEHPVEGIVDWRP